MKGDPIQATEDSIRVIDSIRAIEGLTLMVLGVQITIVGRFLLGSAVFAWGGGVVVLAGLVVE